MKIYAYLILFFLMPSISQAFDDGVSYIEPSSIKVLSSEVISDLESKNCKIPIPKEFKFGGFIVGEFAATKQIDLAVICVSNLNKQILLYWGGVVTCPSTIPSMGQYISLATERVVYNYVQSEGGSENLKMSHSGIDDVYLGKASVVWYCENNQWKKPGGAD